MNMDLQFQGQRRGSVMESEHETDERLMKDRWERDLRTNQRGTDNKYERYQYHGPTGIRRNRNGRD